MILCVCRNNFKRVWDLQQNYLYREATVARKRTCKHYNELLFMPFFFFFLNISSTLNLRTPFCYDTVRYNSIRNKILCKILFTTPCNFKLCVQMEFSQSKSLFDLDGYQNCYFMNSTRIFYISFPQCSMWRIQTANTSFIFFLITVWYCAANTAR